MRQILAHFLILLFLVITFGIEQAAAEKRGYLRSRACPFSCRTEGIDKNHCKDWRVGNTCYVEDLSRPPNKPVPAPPRAPPPPQKPGYPSWGNNGPSWGNHDRYPGDYNGGNNYNDRNECRSGSYLARPRVNIYRVKPSGNMFGDKYKVRGEVEGVCLGEAGYFEYGRKRQNIPVATTRNFRRFEFEVTVKSSERPEIRVYNVNGDMDYVSIAPEAYDAKQNGHKQSGQRRW